MPNNKAKAQQYRQSEKGRAVMRARRANPEWQAKQKIRRAVKRKMKGGF